MAITAPSLTRAQLAAVFKDDRVRLAFEALLQQVAGLPPDLANVNFVVTAADASAPNAHVITAGPGVSVVGGSGTVTISLTGSVVTQFSAGTTGLTPSSLTAGPITLGGTLVIANGGTGATTAAGARTALGVSATGADTTYAYRANNLSDLTNAATARTNLGLGGAAVLNVGTAAATVAAGDDSRFANAKPGYTTVATDADFTLTRSASFNNVRHTGTLTANRTVTLSTTGAVAGDTVTLTRTGSGAFNLVFAGKNLITSTWAVATYDGAAWYLSAYGTL